MVKHGKDKKRRAGRIGKTKLKNKNFRRWDPNPKVSDALVKEHWDASKSPSENLKSIAVDYPPTTGADVENSIPWAEFGGHDLTQLVTRIKAL